MSVRDAEVDARQHEYDVAFRSKKAVTKYYIVAEVDDGLPPIKQEISATRHIAFTFFENVDPSISRNNVVDVDSDVAD